MSYAILRGASAMGYNDLQVVRAFLEADPMTPSNHQRLFALYCAWHSMHKGWMNNALRSKAPLSLFRFIRQACEGAIVEARSKAPSISLRILPTAKRVQDVDQEHQDRPRCDRDAHDRSLRVAPV
jgi:hypothetical protein